MGSSVLPLNQLRQASPVLIAEGSQARGRHFEQFLRVNPLDSGFLFVGVLFLETSRGAIIKTLSKTVDE